MYHERQTRQMCLVHALNALFQKPQFTAETLDEICYSLSDKRWFNPHRSMLGLGNYDVNVLMSALGMYDYQRIRFENLDAIIVNVPTGNYIPFWKGRHWYTILRQDNRFFNLDSKLSKPEEITDITQHCRSLLSKTEDSNQLFLVGKGDPTDFVSVNRSAFHELLIVCDIYHGKINNHQAQVRLNSEL
ncbi:unnamed protein product [Cylicocyclus nassatus]|uniref:ubiquitinyl hydrolase 1 n=1 Tax=Cylicocyclus nassatus TaxID=53992 RepID=A0AA36HG46_CYLNA|nr:unnamed protein product [Cylicocyclus nassatus]